MPNCLSKFIFDENQKMREKINFENRLFSSKNNFKEKAWLEEINVNILFFFIFGKYFWGVLISSYEI